MHIQGTNYQQLTAAFVKQFDKCENSDATQIEENHDDDSKTSLKVPIKSNIPRTSNCDTTQNKENQHDGSETFLKLVFQPN